MAMTINDDRDDSPKDFDGYVVGELLGFGVCFVVVTDDDPNNKANTKMAIEAMIQSKSSWKS